MHHLCAVPERPSASIHFPLAREDNGKKCKKETAGTLQSTSLLRGKTRPSCSQQLTMLRFNPLPSCEGRHIRPTETRGTRTLQSTSLLRGKTRWPWSGWLGKTLQSTSLLRGKTNHPLNRPTQYTMLQSTSLLRGKTIDRKTEFFMTVASIHFPLAREDAELPNIKNDSAASIHFPLAREDHYEVFSL